MGNEIAETKSKLSEDTVTEIILSGNLNALKPNQLVEYYHAYCERVGLDPVTKPFDVISLTGKKVLYCTRSGAQQLSKKHAVSHTITSREKVDDAYTVTCRASLADGRSSESIGAVPIAGLKGEAYCNALMKCETKAKRRATLDLLGLGVLDECEVESIVPRADIVRESITHDDPLPAVGTVVQSEAAESREAWNKRIFALADSCIANGWTPDDVQKKALNALESLSPKALKSIETKLLKIKAEQTGGADEPI